MRNHARRKSELADARKNYDDVYARITDLVVSADLNAELIRADAAATTIDFDYKLESSDKLRDGFDSINDEFTTLECDYGSQGRGRSPCAHQGIPRPSLTVSVPAQARGRSVLMTRKGGEVKHP